MKRLSLIRRLICLCLTLSVIVAVFSAVPVLAAGTTEVVFGEVMGKIGDEVTVPVTVTNNPGIATFRFRITYNTDDLTFISAEKGDVLTKGTISSTTDAENKTMTFLWYSAENVTADGEIAKLKFNIKDTAKGEYALKVTYLAEDLLNENRTPVGYTVKDGKISTGITLSGKITSFGDVTAAVTVRLLENEKELNSIQTTNGTYSFGSVSPGNYTVEVSKLNHATRKYFIAVEREDITQDVKIHLVGDINGDGKVNITDVNRANAHANKSKTLTDYDFVCADTNGDGKVNISDVNKINAHATKVKTLW